MKIRKESSFNQPLATKLSLAELKQVDTNAKKYCGGNRSEYLRTAALNYKPNKKDFK